MEVTIRTRSRDARLEAEFVERKGLGHPDTLCDAIAERASRYYSLHCLREYGAVPHHWFDKVMLLGGESVLRFGSGQLVRPYVVIFAGKCALHVGAATLPIYELFRAAATDVLSGVLTGFDPARHLIVRPEVVDHQGASRLQSRYRPTSSDDLVDLDTRGRVSNDSNLLSGFAPLSPLENVVLETEQHLNSQDFKQSFPATGSDIKIVGQRIADDYYLVVNVPWIADRIESPQAYIRRTAELREYIVERLQTIHSLSPTLVVNANDRGGVHYLTALGSVADTGDVGVVGRGNRINGLITPMRPMSIEAPAGKNPLDHTGKLLGIVSHRLATELETFAERDVEVHILTSKERPLEDPETVLVSIAGDVPSTTLKAVDLKVRERVASVYEVSRELILTGIELW